MSRAATTTGATTQERRRRILNLAINGGGGGGGGELIPCRIEVEHDGYRLSEVFLIEEGTGPEAIDLLAAQMTSEYDLPAEVFTGLLNRFLRDQVDEFSVFRGALAGTPVPFSELPPIPMRIDIIVGLTRLQDRIELSLECESSAVAALAQEYSAPGLSREDLEQFRPLLLHSLLEQLLMWRKAVVFGGWHRDPRTGALKFHDPEVLLVLQEVSQNNNINAGPAGATVRRHPAMFATFTPAVTQLTPAELDKIESSRERESRRKRRTTSAAAAASAASKSGRSQAPLAVNMLTGSIKSPPRTLPTATSYRGSLHRIVQSKLLVDDDDSSVIGPGSTGSGRRGGRRK